MQTTKYIDAWLKRFILGCGLGLVTLACGSEDDGGGNGETAAGGSCTTPDACWEVSTPENYDVRTECAFTQGNWSADTCDASQYARKCTQVTQVSENGGPETDVSYVYYFPTGSTSVCLGTEETL